MPLDGITRFCFGASYAVALLLELLQLAAPRPVQRLVAIGFGAAGLLAHTAFLVVQRPSLSSQFGSLLLLAWVLAVFYLYGSLHYRKVVWGVFVLPVVLGLVVLSSVYPQSGNGTGEESTAGFLPVLQGERIWSFIHGGLLLLAAVGVSVAFVASVMYLVQARRLRAKVPLGQGARLLSLERLEQMNRRAINLSFPLLTAGVLLGIVLMAQHADEYREWTDPRIVGGAVLWLVFALVLYLRYGAHLRGRPLAFLTILAFALLMFALASSHRIPGDRNSQSEAPTGMLDPQFSLLIGQIWKSSDCEREAPPQPPLSKGGRRRLSSPPTKGGQEGYLLPPLLRGGRGGWISSPCELHCNLETSLLPMLRFNLTRTDRVAASIRAGGGA